MPLCAQGLGDLELGLWRGAGEDDLSIALHELSHLVGMVVIEVRGVHDHGPIATDADLAGDRRGGQRVVARDHDDPDSRRVAACDRLPHLGARRIEHRHQAQEAQVSLGVLTRGRRALRSGTGDEPAPAPATPVRRTARRGG